MEQRKKLGEIFVAQGIITEKTVMRVLALSALLGRRFGTILEEMTLITGEELAAALAIQYGCKIVSGLENHEYAPELLELVPVEVAMNNLIFPLKREGERLALAMADPTDTKVVTNIATDYGLVIVPVIASRKDINSAICRHYLGREYTPSEQKTLLLVDDDYPQLRGLTELFIKNGYRVVTAHDGIEGFKAVIAEKPHVIIAAKQLPKLDAFGLFDALQKLTETKFIPVILITAALTTEEEERIFEKGFYDCIIKPLRDVTLLTRVKRAHFFFDHHYRLI